MRATSAFRVMVLPIRNLAPRMLTLAKLNRHKPDWAWWNWCRRRIAVPLAPFIVRGSSMTKPDKYRKLCDEAMNVEFRGKSKAEMKAILDDLLGRALAVARKSDGRLSDWEKVHFADVITEVDCGLFWLARATFVKAVTPDAPKAVRPEPPNEDLDRITLEQLVKAAEWLRYRPTQECPIFMRK